MSGANGIFVTGLQELAAKLNAAAGKVPNEVGRALYEEATIEKTESQRRTPVDTGALRASHEVTKPNMKMRDISVTILVGGSAAPYGWHVHENLDAYHKVGRSKFLESTILESKPYMAQRVANRINLNRIIA